ncbi:hypothetical protein BH10PSE9_BH10PSE9_13080 [soil metagenome]
MRVEELLRESAARNGPGVAIVAGRGRHSYAELDVKSDRLALALQSRGFRARDRLAAFMDNGFAAAVSLFATLKAGGVFNPIDPSLPAEELAQSLEAGASVAIATDSRRASVSGAALALARSVRLVVLTGGNLAPATPTCLSFEEVVGRTSQQLHPAPACEDSDPALAFGRAAPFSHREVLAAAAGEAETLAGLSGGGESGLLRLIAAIRAGTTMVLGTRADRAIGLPAFAAPQAARYAEAGAGRIDSPRIG